MTFTLPALGFAVGSALFERPPVAWEAVGEPGDFPDDTYVPKVITTVQGIGEVGKTTVYVRAYNPDIDGPKDPEIPGGGDFIALSTRCMHLGCPVRFVEASAALHLPVPRRRLRLHRQRLRRPAGAPARPLLHARARTARSRSGRATRSTPTFERFPSYRDPAQDLDGIGQYLYPGRFSTPKLD